MVVEEARVVDEARDNAVADPAPGLTVAVVARRLGVAPATLRTWDRRYGLGPGGHAAGTHRRYTEADLARLDHMRRLVISGVPPAQAASWARALDPAALDPAALATADHPDGPASTGAGTGASAGAPTRGLSRAAQALDQAACEQIIGASIEQRGVVWTWDRLVLPVLTAVGLQWQQTGRGVEIEHSLSAAVQAVMTQVASRLTSPVNARTVLLASAPDDPHTLPPATVGAALAERRIGSRSLGASLPTAALGMAIERLGPAAVFLWAQIPGTADAGALADLPACRPRTTLIIGGAGWWGTPPAGVVHVSDLSDTVARIAHAVGE